MVQTSPAVYPKAVMAITKIRFSREIRSPRRGNCAKTWWPSHHDRGRCEISGPSFPRGL